VNVSLADVAAKFVPAPPAVIVTVTGPTPVKVKTPAGLMVAGPVTEKAGTTPVDIVTPLLLYVEVNVTWGVVPKVALVGPVTISVCAAPLTAIDCCTVVNAKLVPEPPTVAETMTVPVPVKVTTPVVGFTVAGPETSAYFGVKPVGVITPLFEYVEVAINVSGAP
jgi:hypothetical protein